MIWLNQTDFSERNTNQSEFSTPQTTMARFKLLTQALVAGFTGILSAGSVYHRTEQPKFPTIMSDQEALKSDWEAVGKDLLSAMKEFEAQDGRQQKA